MASVAHQLHLFKSTRTRLSKWSCATRSLFAVPASPMIQCARLLLPRPRSHRHMSTAVQTGAGHDVSTQTDPVPPAYKRIRLAFQDDFYTAFSLVAAYLNRPAAAHCVKEVLVDIQTYGHPFLGAMSETPKGIQTINDDTLEKMAKHAQSLGIGEEISEMMSKSLEQDISSFRASNSEWRLDKSFNPAIATMLISLCPNITTLRVWGVQASSCLGQLLLKNNYGLLANPVLQKLKTVQLHPIRVMDDRQYARMDSLDHVRYFHRLPGIRLLSMEAIQDYEFVFDVFPPESSPGIKELHLSHMDLTSDLTCPILRMPKNLEKLSISNRGLSRDFGAESIEGDILGRCLHEQKNSLRELDLDVAIASYGDCRYGVDEEFNDHEDLVEFAEEVMEKWYIKQDREDSESDLPLKLEDMHTMCECMLPKQTVGSLHDFQALKRLSIRIGALLGYDDTQTLFYERRHKKRELRFGVEMANKMVYHPYDGPPCLASALNIKKPTVDYRLIDALPPNLEFLRLYGYRKGDSRAVDRHVAELMEEKAALFPNLREIEGVDEFLPGIAGTYDGRLRDGDHWVRPEDNLDWAEA